MQVLKAVAIMTFAYILPVMTVSPSSTAKSVAKPKLISTLKDNFTLRVLAPDSRGKINLQNSDPLVTDILTLREDSFATVPITGLANIDATVFSLKNKKLITGGSTATLLPEGEGSFFGYRAFVFFSDAFPEPVNFTATEASDSYGRSFLRLGSGDGKNPFIIDSFDGGPVFYSRNPYEPAVFIGTGLNLTLAIRFV